MAWDKIENGSKISISRFISMTWDKIEIGSKNE